MAAPPVITPSTVAGLAVAVATVAAAPFVFLALDWTVPAAVDGLFVAARAYWAIPATVLAVVIVVPATLALASYHRSNR